MSTTSKFSMPRASLLFVVLSSLPQLIVARSCPSNETYPNHYNLSYTDFNATGSYDFTSIYNPYNFTSIAEWTWSTGIVSANNSGQIDYEQPIWLDTHGTDLASPNLGFNMCYAVLTGLSQSMQQRGKNDNGNCKTLLGSKCVEDWIKTLSAAPFSYDYNATGYSPCLRALSSWPKSCKELGGLDYPGTIPPINSTCAFGDGDPNYDSIISLSSYWSASTSDLSSDTFYDELVTRTIPVFAIGWADTWGEARVTCLKTPNITEGSRKPAGIPSSATGLRLSMTALSWIALPLVASLLL